MKNRDQLEQLKISIAEKLGMDDKKTCAEVFKVNIDVSFAEFTKYVGSGEHTDAEITAASVPVKDAISIYNDLMRVERLESLQPLGYDAAVAEYLRSQCVTGFALKNDSKNGWAVAVKKDVEVTAWDFLWAMMPTEAKGVTLACCVWMDNFSKVVFNDASKSITSPKASPAAYKDMRKRMGWELHDISKSGKGLLLNQLNELIQRMFHVETNMIRADLKFIEYSIFTSKSKGDSAGSFVMRNEETAVNAIFRALYTRVNKLPYNFQHSLSEPNLIAEDKAEDKAKPAKAKKQPAKAAKKAA